MQELCLNIKKYRLAAKMTQSDLARKLGYTDRSTIAKIESGVVDLTVPKIMAFADALGVSPGVLMGGVSAEEAKENDDIITVVEKLENDPELLRATLSLINMPEPQRTAMVQMLLSFGAK